MFFFDLHIVGSECYTGEILGGLEIMSFILLFTFKIWTIKASESASASLRASLVDLESQELIESDFG